MFDFDVGKLLIFGIVALAVISPKDLPRVMRLVGQALGRMRRMAAEFQGQFMDAMREVELESVKKELDGVKSDFANVQKELNAIELTAKIELFVRPVDGGSFRAVPHHRTAERGRPVGGLADRADGRGGQAR